IFQFGNNTMDEPNSAKCNINMEHVKEVGELIGVSWVRAEEGLKMEKQVDVVSVDEGTVIGKNQ
ncbi:hypothetical protein Tco_0605059, partial [Tanacetum coccineum]